MQKNGPYLHRFLDEGGYKTFIKGCMITDKGKDEQKRKYFYLQCECALESYASVGNESYDWRRIWILNIGQI